MAEKDAGKKRTPVLYGIMIGLCIVAAVGGSTFMYLYNRYADFGAATANIQQDEAAYRAAGYAWEAKDICPRFTPDDERASALLFQARDELLKNRHRIDQKAVISCLNSKQYGKALSILDAQSSELHLVRLASDAKALDLKIDPDRFADQPLPILYQTYRFIQNLCMRANALAGLGKDEDALAELRCAWKLSTLVARAPSSSAVLSGLLCESTVLSETEQCGALWLDRPGPREAMAELISHQEDLCSVTYLYRIFAYEGLVSIRNFDHPLEALAVAGQIPGGDELPGISSTHQGPVLRTGLPKDERAKGLAARHFQLWQEVAMTIGKNTTDPIKLSKGLRIVSSRWNKRETGSVVLAAIESTALAEFATAVGRLEAQSSVTRALLASMDVRNRLHRWPTQIAEIPGNWDDPFSHKPLRLKQDGASIRIYSLGPDMKDDGGKRRSEIKKSDDQNAYDIVASYPAYVSSRL